MTSTVSAVHNLCHVSFLNVLIWWTLGPVSVRCANYLLSRSANSEDEEEQTGWEQLPYEEDGAKGQVAPVAQFTTQVSLQANTHRGYLL